MVSSPKKLAAPMTVMSFSSSMYHAWVTFFLFLVVIICVLCGQQGGLVPARKVKDLNVTGQLIHNELRKKTYVINFSSIAGRNAAGLPRAIGRSVTGFSTGHVVIFTGINVITGTNGNMGALTLRIGTQAENNFDGQNATLIVGAAATGDSETVASYAGLPTGDSSSHFSNTNNTLGIYAGDQTAGALGSIQVYFEVIATPGSPDLP